MAEKKPRPYINPYLGGAILGIVLFLSFYITGNGLGASGAINHVHVALLSLISQEHVDSVAYFAEIGGGGHNPLQHPSVFMLLGTFAGGMISGLINRRFKPETRKGANISVRSRWMYALIGGIIMGYGARLARGCTSGQALSGGAVLSVGSFAFMFAVFGGGYALAYFVRRLWQQEV